MQDKDLYNFHKFSSDLLIKIYQTKYFPVAIKFLKKEENDFGIPRSKERKSVCAFIKIAARGNSFYIDKDSISCPGGLKWMGFPSKLTETYFYKYFLGEVEKIKSSAEIAEKFIEFLPPPPKEGLYQKIIFTPLKECQFEPDVILLITSPTYTYRAIIDAYLDEYHLVKTIPICAACHGIISIPLTTGELNISLIDPMSRKLGGYKNDEILIGIPYSRFKSLIKNIKSNSYNLEKENLLSKIIRKIID